MKTNLLLLTAALAGKFLLSLARAETPPEIIDPPLTQFAWPGRSVTFEVSFTNPPPLTFQWQWQGTNLADATNRTLWLAVVALTNGGDYRVVLSNSAGVTTSAVARLTVREWPQPTGVSFTNLGRLETNLQTLMRTHDVPGASVAIMKDGRLIAARGFGYADPEAGEQVQPDSLFRIYSLSKAITATAVLNLVDEGRLNLDDPVFPLLNLPPPAFPGANPDPRLTNITVRHLLNHTGGWNRDTARNPLGKLGFDPWLWPQRCASDLGLSGDLSARDFVRWLAGFPLQNAPGRVFSYSNNGYIIAGVLIEQLTGRSFAEAVRSLLAQSDVTGMRISNSALAERRPDEVIQFLSPLSDFRAGYDGDPIASVTAGIPYYFPRDIQVRRGTGADDSAGDLSRSPKEGFEHASPVPPAISSNLRCGRRLREERRPSLDHTQAKCPQDAQAREAPGGTSSLRPFRHETIPMAAEEFIHKTSAVQDRAIHQVADPQA